MDLDDEWDSFMTDPTFKSQPIIERVREHKETPTCDPITISTKTKIIYLNISIDLFQRFWDLPMIDYDKYGEGIIKKQIKFNFVSKEELENFNDYVSREPRLKDGKGIQICRVWCGQKLVAERTRICPPHNSTQHGWSG